MKFLDSKALLDQNSIQIMFVIGNGAFEHWSKSGVADRFNGGTDSEAETKSTN